MKKVCFLLLVILTGTMPLCAQSVYAYNVNAQKIPSRSDQIFGVPLGYERIRFEFYFITGNRITMQFTRLEHVNEVPPLDSLFTAVWKALQPFHDSLEKPLVNRRVDFLQTDSEQRIRMQEYPQKGSVYRIRDADTSLLKVEQDTLVIRLPSKPKAMGIVNIQYPYFITLHLNNISDITTFRKEDLDWALATLKADLGRNLTAPQSKTRSSRFYAGYNVTARRKFSPTKTGVSQFPKTYNWQPYIQGGIQYVRGTWAPSAGVGMEFSWRQHERQTTYARLYWEPYFFFNRDMAAKKTSVDRADFITLGFGDRTLRTIGSRELSFAVYFSASYALRTESGWLEENTFKFSLPGMETKNLMLMPEFYFNGFFKNFSPALKLVLHLE